MSYWYATWRDKPGFPHNHLSYKQFCLTVKHTFPLTRNIILCRRFKNRVRTRPFEFHSIPAFDSESLTNVGPSEKATCPAKKAVPRRNLVSEHIASEPKTSNRALEPHIARSWGFLGMCDFMLTTYETEPGRELGTNLWEIESTNSQSQAIAGVRLALRSTS